MKKYIVNVMDIETFTENNKVYPYCICLKLFDVYNTFWFSGSIVTDFLNFIVDNSFKNEVEIYTHNINFDGLIILDEIKNKGIHFDMYVRENNIYWIKIIYLKTLIKIRCSYKIIPISISNLGLMINLQKKVFPYSFVNRYNLDYSGEIPNKSFFNSLEDYAVFVKNNSEFNLKKTSIAYCMQDVKIIENVLTNILPIIIKYYGNSNIINNCYSFSSISYNLYSKKYDFLKITKNKINIFNSEYIRNGYYGGRCEVFGNPIEGEIIHYFDYKGMYAQCMLEKFPTSIPYISKNNLSVYKPGFHTIRFKCKTYLPYLPVRLNKLIFPEGEHVGVFWYEEIINAIDNGKCEILEHYSSLIYDNQNYVFKEYVEEFMKIRNKGIYYNIFGKNAINGLYGSFALREDNEIYVVCTNDLEFDAYRLKTDIISFKKIGFAYIIKIKKNLKSKKILDKENKWDLMYRERNLSYAAIIASKARIKLNNSLNLVLNDGGRLYYTDTDSIFAGYKKNKINEKIGDIIWSKTYNEGIFVSSKFYFLEGDEIKLKGINKNEYDYREIKKKFYSNEKEIIFENQLSFPKSNFEIFELIKEKHINIFGYDKRIFIKNKKDTKPLFFQTDSVQ